MIKKVANGKKTEATATAKRSPRKKESTTSKTSSTPKRKSSGKSKAKSDEREVVYPQVELMVADTDDPLTVDKAKKLLGWKQETDIDKWTNDYLFKLDSGKKVRCLNNPTNRPLQLGRVKVLVQEILQKRWRLNGEPIILGKTGTLLNGQHTLIALILAAEKWEKNSDATKWDEEPWLEKVIVAGIDESDETVNTMDTCKPRSISDVLYRSEFFAGISKKDRNTLSKMAGNAVRIMWDRTRAKDDAFAPIRTVSESVDFLERHPKLVDAVKFVYEEDGSEGKVSRFVSPGYAAGLLYLMGVSSTSEDTEYGTTPEETKETTLNLDRWEQAEEFWTLLAGGSSDLSAVKHALAVMIEDEYGVSLKERLTLIVKAWNTWIAGKKVTESAISLDYETDEHGIPWLVDSSNLGGIDFGLENAE